MTRDQVRAQLEALARGLPTDEDAAVGKLLERVAAGGWELRDMLLEEGARSLLQRSRASS